MKIKLKPAKVAIRPRLASARPTAAATPAVVPPQNGA